MDVDISMWCAATLEPFSAVCSHDAKCADSSTAHSMGNAADGIWRLQQVGTIYSVMQTGLQAVTLKPGLLAV